MKRKTHPYQSKAKVEKITDYEYESYGPSNQDNVTFYCAKMPVLIQTDGTLWELGNIYLHHLLVQKSRSQATLESVASGLVDFLRFIEHFDLDILHLPDQVHERVTYRYKSSLLQRIRQNNIRPSTGRGRICNVLGFYRFCIDNEMFDIGSLRNTPYTEIKRRFTIPTDYGSTFQIDVLSSDLAIRSAKHHISSDEIQDGGVLRPLMPEEQTLVERYLQHTASREFQLMCYLSLYTGARLQTVATIRVFNIKKLKERVPDRFKAYSLTVGSGSVIDTKNGTQITLKIPQWLVDELISYSKSQVWRNRAKLSYYGVTDENYIFLTSQGASYYTSLKEIEDRRTDNSLRGFKQCRGLSIRPHIALMINKINSDKVRVSHFRFHDLRATFGMNTLNEMIRSGLGNDQALWYLKERMGHKNIYTTMRYLDHTGFTSSLIDTNNFFSDALNTERHG